MRRLVSIAVFLVAVILVGGSRAGAADELAAYEAAVSKYGSGDLNGALVEIGKVITKAPKDGIARYYHGLFLERKGDVTGAEKSYRLAIELKPDLAEAHGNLCALRYQAKDHNKAIALCERAVALNNDLEEAWYNLGLANQAAGRAKEAAYAFERFTVLAPTKPDGWMSFGALTLRAGNKKGAVTAFREAARLAPADFLAHFNLGAALAASADLDGAVPELTRATELRPDYVAAFHRLGSVQRRRGHAAEAVAAQEKARALEPGDPAVALELGLSYAARNQKGDEDRALGELDRAEKLARSSWEPPFYLGIVNAGAGRCFEAKKAFERYRDRDPKGGRAAAVAEALARCQGG